MYSESYNIIRHLNGRIADNGDFDLFTWNDGTLTMNRCWLMTERGIRK
ncbi:MAG TPA: hypothetical protein PK992_06675 [Planctomycetaceae bacterium]|nr:hypothetical protein [Planctomycetaceae bacterium]